MLPLIATLCCLSSTFILGASAGVATNPQHGPQSPFSNPHPNDFVTDRRGDILWDYTGDTGPLLWSKLNKKEWAECSTGTVQSPINIDEKMKPSGFKYQWSAPMRACYNMTNLGNTIELTPTCGGSGGGRKASEDGEEEEAESHEVKVQIDNDWFNLQAIRFHTPSEHRFLDEYFPLEAHFVMYSPNTNRYAIRAIFFDVANIRESDLFDGISPFLWNVRNPGQWVKLPAVNTYNIMMVFQRLGVTNRVYNYQGSLTHPPCAENVIWDVMSVPQTMSVATYNLFKKIMKFNARYTQNMPGRGNLLAEACAR